MQFGHNALTRTLRKHGPCQHVSQVMRVLDRAASLGLRAAQFLLKTLREKHLKERLVRYIPLVG
jgi:hypothetical protein